MMRKIIFLFLLGLSVSLSAQMEMGDKNAWVTLGKISFKKEFDEFLGFKVDVPVFSQDVKALAGEYIELRGYIIPTEGYKTQREFIFSAFPYNLCFFCGGAGPETVIEVEAAEDIQYTADQITIRGKLGLNDSDLDRMMYIMTDATIEDR